MNPIVRNILAILGGWLVGSLVNIGLIQLGYLIMPIEGIDPANMEELVEIMPTLSKKHFIFPFLAHALGTLAGAVIAALIATKHQMKFSLGIGVVFLIGGVLASIMLPAPTWFVLVDLTLAYIPMAWLGGKMVMGK